MAKLWKPCDFWLQHIEDRVFRGAYFFAGAFFEHGRQRGAVARQIKAAARDWLEALQRAVKEAQKHKEIDRDAHADETAFELNGLLLAGRLNTIPADKRKTPQLQCSSSLRNGPRRRYHFGADGWR